MGQLMNRVSELLAEGKTKMEAMEIACAEDDERNGIVREKKEEKPKKKKSKKKED